MRKSKKADRVFDEEILDPLEYPIHAEEGSPWSIHKPAPEKEEEQECN